MHKKHYSFAIQSEEPVSLVDFLAGETGISKIKIKDAMQKGAVWVRRGKQALLQMRRATTTVRKGDVVELYFDEAALKKTAPAAQRLWVSDDYSLWYKPAGMLAQGTNYGDHLALLRHAAQAMPQVKTTYLVHRLDREADGLMLIAHNSKTAHALSQLFVNQQIEKRYTITVKGLIEPQRGEIDLPLDDKAALTQYQVISSDAVSQTTKLSVTIKTGRTHQIRRHFDAIGHPVMGDPKYGSGNKNTEGMQLTASYLRFTCPLSGKLREFDLVMILRNSL